MRPFLSSLWFIRRWSLVLLTLGIFFTGCSELQTEYGATTGSSGRRSINGFGSFREAFESLGHMTHDVRRLSDRTARNDVVVWIPQAIGPISLEATEWFDDWLSEGNHTLVYLLPDSGNEVEYWQQAQPLSQPSQRVEYRRKQSRALNERFQWRLNRQNVVSNGWFQIESLPVQIPVEKLGGLWSDDVSYEGGSPNAAGWGIEFRVGAFDEDVNEQAKSIAGMTSGQVGPSGQGIPFFNTAESYDSDDWDFSFDGLLLSQNDDVLVGEVTSSRWNDSRVLVVAGGSLLTNFSLTKAVSRQLGGKVIDRATDFGDPSGFQEEGRHVAFLVTHDGTVPVSDANAGAPTASGMELLSVWPLSLITIHATVLGIISVLVIWPIFGRPKRVQRSSQSDFGIHLDAVAALMKRSGGEQYARQRISDYMRQVGGETKGPWILPVVAPRADPDASHSDDASVSTNSSERSQSPERSPHSSSTESNE